jgi:hypothetical protein
MVAPFATFAGAARMALAIICASDGPFFFASVAALAVATVAMAAPSNHSE